jgi:hypothetical protein
MLTLDNIEIANGGRRINYLYTFSDDIKKYFSRQRLYVEYPGVDVSRVPDSIKAIPFVANMLPIAWFAGFDISVKVLDETFFHSTERLKSIFADLYPAHIKAGAKIVCEDLRKNEVTGEGSAVLFSGGIDAFATFLRHENERPTLVTVRGADMPITDHYQWRLLQRAIQNAALLRNAEKTTVNTNMRRFYSHRVNLMIDNLDWWGRVQHGMAMLSLLAPLCASHSFRKIYIASSSTEERKFKWGSSPEIDRNMRWGNVEVEHDAYEIDRFNKVRLLVDTVRSRSLPLQVKVCYQPGQVRLNCSKCDKCTRSILLFICAGADPNLFGFKTNEQVYINALRIVEGGFSSEAMKRLWQAVADAIKARKEAFHFSRKDEEGKKLDEIAGLIERQMSFTVEISARRRYLQILQLRFPWMSDVRNVILRMGLRNVNRES